jgi:hypothetical protein
VRRRARHGPRKRLSAAGAARLVAADAMVGRLVQPTAALEPTSKVDRARKTWRDGWRKAWCLGTESGALLCCALCRQVPAPSHQSSPCPAAPPAFFFLPLVGRRWWWGAKEATELRTEKRRLHQVLSSEFLRQLAQPNKTYLHKIMHELGVDTSRCQPAHHAPFFILLYRKMSLTLDR